jgi:hypothetical protein
MLLQPKIKTLHRTMHNTVTTYHGPGTWHMAYAYGMLGLSPSRKHHSHPVGSAQLWKSIFADAWLSCLYQQTLCVDVKEAGMPAAVGLRT